MDEQGLIARFLRPFDRTRRGVELGPGDDAALLKPSPGQTLVVTTDAVFEGLHFGPRFLPGDIGHKALAVNLSDLAAMGARPRWFLVALEVSPRVTSALLDGVARGMAALARRHGCVLVGGNVARGPRLGLTITALGEVPARLALRRDRLRPGDLIAVTGVLGAAALGLRRLRTGTRRAARSQLRPEPRIAAGLAARGLSHAAIDVSDGLALDLTRMAQASSARIDLRADAIPRAPGASLAMALSGGEDYEMVFGLRPAGFSRLKRKLERLALPLTAVGEVRRGTGLFLDGAPLEPLGFDHLK